LRDVVRLLWSDPTRGVYQQLPKQTELVFSSGLRYSVPMKAMTSIAAAALALLSAQSSIAQPCPCDCNGDRTVRVDELTTAVNITLERLAMASCPPADTDGDANVEINELIAGVG